jgi:hypothetical protein
MPPALSLLAATAPTKRALRLLFAAVAVAGAAAVASVLENDDAEDDADYFDEDPDEWWVRGADVGDGGAEMSGEHKRKKKRQRREEEQQESHGGVTAADAVEAAEAALLGLWAQLPGLRGAEGFLSAPAYLPATQPRRRGPEPVDMRPSTGCPNLLVRHDDLLLLFRDDALVARFASLEDYQTYTAEQAAAAAADTSRDNGGGGAAKKRACPVLFVEPEAAPQGRRRYRRRDAAQRSSDRGTLRGLSAAFWDWQRLGAAPADRPAAAGEDTAARAAAAERLRFVRSDGGAGRARPYNADAMEPWLRADLVRAAAVARAAPVSDSAMDANWGGVRWSQRAIDSGKYDGHTLTRPPGADSGAAAGGPGTATLALAASG